MATSPLQAFPTPELSDLVGGWPSASLAQMAAVEKQTVMIFSTSSVRNAAIPSPTAGMVAYLTTPKQLTLYDGTGWVILDEPPQSWSNPFTGISGGSPSFSGAYQRRGGYCRLEGRLTFGGTPSVISSLAVTLPFTAARTITGQQLVATMTDTGSVTYVGVFSGSTAAPGLFVASAGGTYVSLTTISASLPHTWVASDLIDISGEYEMASRYS